MQREVAIIVFFVVLVFFALVIYYGVHITLWSSIILALLISLIIMNVFYPPSQVPKDAADYTLIIYAVIEIFGVFLLAIYIVQHTICDVRRDDCICYDVEIFNNV